MKRIAILVPAFQVLPWKPVFVNQLKVALQDLESRWALKPALIFVDDGSDQPGTRLEDHRPILAALDCQVLGAKHSLNRGQGAAIQTALDIALLPPVCADYFVTLDSDGQHDPADIAGLFATLVEKNLNIVFGNRFDPERLAKSGIPFKRRLLLRTATLVERLTTGLDLQDAHNGFRLFDRLAAEKIRITQDRMAHATEIKVRSHRARLRYGEAPVTITYTEESLGAGQRNTDAVKILVDLAEGWWFR